MAKRSAPEVNAGSMADIAFLLLIFFLVTTTIETDSGLSRKLPPMEDERIPPIIKQKNIFQLSINGNNQLLLKADDKENIIEIKDLRQATIDFLDNGGGEGDSSCKRCRGKKSKTSSDNFSKAIVSLQTNRMTDYETYIAAQNEIIAAYNFLRNREFQREYPRLGMNFAEAEKKYNDGRTSATVKVGLKNKLSKIRELIPQVFSEAQPKKS